MCEYVCICVLHASLHEGIKCTCERKLGISLVESSHCLLYSATAYTESQNKKYTYKVLKTSLFIILLCVYDVLAAYMSKHHVCAVFTEA